MARNVRLAFSKTGRMAWLSHLDLMAVFARSFARARLPLRYTEGFNPHAYLSVALPLPVGFQSVCERLDFGMLGEPDYAALPGIISAALPDGLRVTAAGPDGRKLAEVLFAGYRMEAETGASPERVAEVFSRPVFVDKRAKKGGTVRTDITPMIRSLSCAPAPNGLTVSVVVAAQNPTLNPEYIADAWRELLDPDAAFRFTRTAIYGADGELFDNL